MIKFKAKTGYTHEELDEMWIKHNDGWVEGNLVWNDGDPFIIGDVVEALDDYFYPEYWVPVLADSLLVVIEGEQGISLADGRDFVLTEKGQPISNPQAIISAADTSEICDTTEINIHPDQKIEIQIVIYNEDGSKDIAIEIKDEDVAWNMIKAISEKGE